MQLSSICCNLSLLRHFARCPPGPLFDTGAIFSVQYGNSWKRRQPAEDVMFDKRPVIVITLGILLLLSMPLSGQQSYVSRFDVYGGYGFLDSPKVNLFENGFAAQVGFRPTTWLSLGFDYTVAAGDLKITPKQLLPALQTQLQAGIAQGIGAGLVPLHTQYNYAGIYVPAHSKTETRSEEHTS